MVGPETRSDRPLPSDCCCGLLGLLLGCVPLIRCRAFLSGRGLGSVVDGSLVGVPLCTMPFVSDGTMIGDTKLRWSEKWATPQAVAKTVMYLKILVSSCPLGAPY